MTERVCDIKYPPDVPFHQLGLASTHPDDWDLCKELGLLTFCNLPNGTDLYLGTVLAPHGRFVRVFVYSAPALFFRFYIMSMARGQLQQEELTADSGLLSWYWPTVLEVLERNTKLTLGNEFPTQHPEAGCLHVTNSF
jgi:hypothetical protein